MDDKSVASSICIGHKVLGKVLEYSSVKDIKQITEN